MPAPHAEVIPRTSDATKPSGHDWRTLEPFDWLDVEKHLGGGAGPCWLSSNGDRGPHTRPVFAAWTGRSFVVASNPSARKSAYLDRGPRVSIAIALPEVHLVVEGGARRLAGATDLARATHAFQDVFDWPTTVVGDRLDAEYAAPTSGGPPFNVYEVTPTRAFGFPTADQREPTRWTWNT